MISIQMSIFDRIAEHRKPHIHAAVKPNLDTLRGEVYDAEFGPDLQPTNYCTAMYDGIRCDGDHDSDSEWHRGGHVDNGGALRMWREGYGDIQGNGIRSLSTMTPDIGWSDLNVILTGDDPNDSLYRLNTRCWINNS